MCLLSESVLVLVKYILNIEEYEENEVRTFVHKTNIIKLTITGEIKDARNIECQPFK